MDCVAHQAPLSMGFSRREYWSGLSCPPPGNPNPGVEPRSPALQADSLPSDPPGKPSERGSQDAGSPPRLRLEPRAGTLCARHGVPHVPHARHLPGAQAVKNPPAMRESQVPSLGQEESLEEAWQPTPVFLPGESQGQRSLAGCRSQGHKELDTTERLSLFH